jgi:phosphatidylglycerophosphate synthase
MTTPLIPRSARWTEVRAALADAQKSNRNAPAYSRWVNRPLGRVLAATAYKLGLTPNQVTAISAVPTFAGIVLIALVTPGLFTGVGIAMLLMLGYALDSADGQLARLRGGGSLAGEWLDHVVDSIKVATIHIAIAIMWFRNLDGWPPASTLIPLAFTAQSAVWFFTIMLTDQLERMAGTKAVRDQAAGAGSRLNSILAIPSDYGFLSLTCFLLGWFAGWRVLYTALAVYNVALLALQLVRWYRRIRAVPPSPATSAAKSA